MFSRKTNIRKSTLSNCDTASCCKSHLVCVITIYDVYLNYVEHTLALQCRNLYHEFVCLTPHVPLQYDTWICKPTKSVSAITNAHRYIRATYPLVTLSQCGRSLLIIALSDISSKPPTRLFASEIEREKE